MTTVNLWCPTRDTIDSYGRMVLELEAGLERAGWTVHDFAVNAPSRPSDGTMVLGGILAGIPPMYKLYPTLAHIGPTLALTMFESTLIPPDWVDPLNKCQALVVPSAFLIETFRNSGATLPIHVVPLGISPAFHRFHPRVFTCTEDEPFTFIAIADRGIRKNWGAVMQTFNKAFGDDLCYRLILKSRTGVINFPVTNPNIEVIAQDMDDEALCALYHRAHVMVFPTRGEGFGLPPREFAATGGLALATRWGGTADDIDQWGVPIEQYTMEPAYQGKTAWSGHVGDWAVPDGAALTQQLRDVVEGYEAMNAQAEIRARFVVDTYTWDAFAQGVGQIYQAMLAPAAQTTL